MRYYRQHPIILLGGLLESLLLGGAGMGLALLFGQPWFLALLPVALVLAIWRVLQWATFSVRVEGRQVTLRTLQGFHINEKAISLNAPGSIRLRQNILGYLLDFGGIRIEVAGSPVKIQYIAPFHAVIRQIDQA